MAGRRAAPQPAARARDARAVAERVPAAGAGRRSGPGGRLMLRYAVATPARNEEGNLPRLAASLAAQTQRPTEWIVVDDGSSDATPRILDDLAAEHPWIRRLARTQ